MTKGDQEFWRVSYEFHGPLSGSGSITITSTAVDDVSLRLPTLEEIRGGIRPTLERQMGYPGERFAIVVTSIYKLVENKDYLAECE
jgi:hypothetical protein